MNITYTYSMDKIEHLIQSEGYKSYRKGVYRCGFCGFREEIDDNKKFRNNITEVVFFPLEPNGAWWRKGECLIISECPECFKESFHHFSLRHAKMIDTLDSDRIQEEMDKWKKHAKDEWNNSLCKKCSVDRKVKEQWRGYWINCSKGISCPPRNECEYFEEEETKN